MLRYYLSHVKLIAPILVYLTISLINAPAPPKLLIQRTLSTHRAMPNDEVIICLSITNQGCNLPELHLQDTLPAFLELVDGSTN